MAIATALYVAALLTQAANLGHEPDGPFGAMSTTVALAAQLAAMVLAGALATTATRRGWHAVHEPLSGDTT